MPATDHNLNNFLPKVLREQHSARKDALLNLILNECNFKNHMSKNDLNKFLRKVREKSIALQETIDKLESLKEEYYKQNPPPVKIGPMPLEK